MQARRLGPVSRGRTRRRSRRREVWNVALLDVLQPLRRRVTPHGFCGRREPLERVVFVEVRGHSSSDVPADGCLPEAPKGCSDVGKKLGDDARHGLEHGSWWDEQPAGGLACYRGRHW